MINDNKTYGINAEGRYAEVKGTGGTLTVLNDVFTNTQQYRIDGILTPETLSYDVTTSTYTYAFQDVSESFTDAIPDKVNGDVFTVLYNFVIWYRGTYNV